MGFSQGEVVGRCKLILAPPRLATTRVANSAPGLPSPDENDRSHGRLARPSGAERDAKRDGSYVVVDGTPTADAKPAADG